MLVEGLEQAENLFQLFGRHFLAVGQILQADFLGTILEEDPVELIVVVDVVGPLFAGDRIERRLGDVHVPIPDELGHLAIEEGQQQRTDVGSVDICVSHDDDLVVAKVLDLEGPLALSGSDSRPDGGDHGPDFVVLQNLVETSLLDVDQLASDRKDCLELSVTTLLGRATCRIALDDVQLGVGRVAVGTIGQLAGESTAGEGRFTNRLTRLASRFTGPGCIQSLFDNLLSHHRIVVEVVHQPFIRGRPDDAFDLRRDEFDLRLGLELRIAVLDGYSGRQPFANVIPSNLRVLILQDTVRLGVLIDRPGQGGPETREVRAAIRIVDGVRVAKNLVVVAVVVLHHDMDVHLDLFLGRDGLALLEDADGLRMHGHPILIQLAYELFQPLLVKEGLELRIRLTLIQEGDLEP